MPLIKCYECGKEISDKALSCPHCGAPLSAKVDKTKTTTNVSAQQKKVTQSNTEIKHNEAFSFIGFAVILLIVIVILIRSCSGNNETKIETPSTAQKPSDTNGITEEQKNAAMDVIRFNGYTCDSIAGMNRFITSEGYSVYCNDHRYSYEIANKGGNWIVTVK